MNCVETKKASEWMLDRGVGVDGFEPHGCLIEVWALTDSNRRPSACKADALNQLS